MLHVTLKAMCTPLIAHHVTICGVLPKEKYSWYGTLQNLSLCGATVVSCVASHTSCLFVLMIIHCLFLAVH